MYAAAADDDDDDGKNDDGTDAVAGDVDEADENIEARQPQPESKISSNHQPQC